MFCKAFAFHYLHVRVSHGAIGGVTLNGPDSILQTSSSPRVTPEASHLHDSQQVRTLAMQGVKSIICELGHAVIFPL